MQHDKVISLRRTVISTSLCLVVSIIANVAQAETPKAIAAKVESAEVAASAVQLKPGKIAVEGKTKSGAVIGKTGDNQYPGTTPLPLPKPKKEALEAIGAAKAKAAQ
jgi:hypothetical protein